MLQCRMQRLEQAGMDAAYQLHITTTVANISWAATSGTVLGIVHVLIDMIYTISL